MRESWLFSFFCSLHGRDQHGGDAQGDLPLERIEPFALRNLVPQVLAQEPSERAEPVQGVAGYVAQYSLRHIRDSLRHLGHYSRHPLLSHQFNLHRIISRMATPCQSGSTSSSPSISAICP